MNFVSARSAAARSDSGHVKSDSEQRVDAYFSADVETDGPIPGPYSMLSLALVFAGSFDGREFKRPKDYTTSFYRELKPISTDFELEALAVNGLDRDALIREGADPAEAMADAARWVETIAGPCKPVLVAYPLSFDWTWLYWYFVRFCGASPFNHSQCFDIKTAIAVKEGRPISGSGRSALSPHFRSAKPHTHHALDDAAEQAEIFGNVFEWNP